MLWGSLSWAQTPDSVRSVRLAIFAAPLSRDGPGLLLRDILAADDPQIAAILAIINDVSPDVLLLTDIDFDAGNAALSAFSAALARPYPNLFTLRPNAGLQTGLDLDGDGYAGDDRDAMGYGRFAGDGGMALLSRYPIKTGDVVDYTSLLWRDLPEAGLPMSGEQLFPSAAVFETLRLSSSGHWVVPIDLGEGRITVLASSSTPPVFDGPEDFNGLRNKDELRLWEHLLGGTFGAVPVYPVVMGNTNLDPADGDGLRDAMASFLVRPDLQDPQPRSAGGLAAADPGQRGDPALDTADWPDGRPGNLRVSYILPSDALRVLDAAVYWPDPADPKAAALGDDGLVAGAHRLVWVDVALP